MVQSYEKYCSIFLFFFQFIPQPVQAFHSQTFHGKYFSYHELKTIRAEDWFGCTTQCFEETSCISYNYNKNDEICLLYDHGIEDFSRPEVQLLDDKSWIFHQIRPVTKITNKIPITGPCLCNCGSSNQCYTGLGDIPEKAAKSCDNILEQRSGDLLDGAYYLQYRSQPFAVYCQMTPINECDSSKGGWTLVMKINGSRTNFRYDSPFWNSPELKPYQEENGDDLSEKETKLRTFSSVSFTEMCVGMKLTISTPIKWIKIAFKNKQPTELFPVMSAVQPVPPIESVSLDQWKTLLNGADMPDKSTTSGFNQESSGSKARIGVVGAESYIGLGTGGTEKRASISCGNVHEDKVIPAFCYIMVR